MRIRHIFVLVFFCIRNCCCFVYSDIDINFPYTSQCIIYVFATIKRNKITKSSFNWIVANFSTLWTIESPCTQTRAHRHRWSSEFHDKPTERILACIMRNLHCSSCERFLRFLFSLFLFSAKSRKEYALNATETLHKLIISHDFLLVYLFTFEKRSEARVLLFRCVWHTRVWRSLVLLSCWKIGLFLMTHWHIHTSFR